MFCVGTVFEKGRGQEAREEVETLRSCKCIPSGATRPLETSLCCLAIASNSGAYSLLLEPL